MRFRLSTLLWVVVLVSGYLTWLSATDWLGPPPTDQVRATVGYWTMAVAWIVLCGRLFESTER